MSKLIFLLTSLVIGVAHLSSAHAADVAETELLSTHNFQLPAMKVTNTPDGKVAVRLDEAIIVYPGGSNYRMELASNLKEAFGLSHSRMVSVTVLFDKSDCLVNPEDSEIFTCTVNPHVRRKVLGSRINFTGETVETSEVEMWTNMASIGVAKVSSTDHAGTVTYKQANAYVYINDSEGKLHIPHTQKGPLNLRTHR